MHSHKVYPARISRDAMWVISVGSDFEMDPTKSVSAPLASLETAIASPRNRGNYLVSAKPVEIASCFPSDTYLLLKKGQTPR